MRHKLRTALTTLGIMIGIAAVVLVVAVGEAGSARAEAELQKLGDNLVWIEAGSRNVNGVRNGSHGTTSLTAEDADAIRREVPLIKRISPQVDGTVHVIVGDENWTTRYRGESPDYLAIKRWDIARGRAVHRRRRDRTRRRRCCSARPCASELFGARQSGRRRSIRINGQLFEVVGVLAPKGQNADGRDQDDSILMPYTTAEKKIRGGGLDLARRHPVLGGLARGRRPRHRPRSSRCCASATTSAPGEEDDFNIRRPDEVIKAQLEASARADAAARQHRLDLAARRRHRHHERDARVGRAAHARDRRAPRDRRARRARSSCSSSARR